MWISVNQQCKTPYFRQIANQLKEMILKGEIPDKAMLPSERTMAELCGVHRNTVIRAYHELQADGLIISMQGRGYMVLYHSQENGGTSEPANWLGLIRSDVQDIDTTYNWLFSRSYQKNVISFAGGLVSPEIYSDQVMQQILQLLSRREGETPLFEDAYSYTPYQGMVELRQQLALFFKGKGIQVNARQIQVVADANQGVDFLAEMLLERGDVVLVEDPMSPDLYRMLLLKGIQILAAPTDENGILVEALEPLLQKNRPKLMYVNSSYHDPSGVITSLQRRQELLKLSYRYRIPIVEEDAASELYYGLRQVPSYMSLDRSGMVIYIYSFALTFAPGIKIACVAAPKPVVENMGKIVAMRLTCFDSMSQLLLCECMKSGLYQELLQKTRDLYRRKRDLMYRLLEPVRRMGGQCELPRGGVYVWLRLPDDTVRVEKLRRCAEKKGVLFVPGFLFFPFGTGGQQYIRLNYSFASEEQIKRGVPLLIEAINETREASCGSAEEKALPGNVEPVFGEGEESTLINAEETFSIDRAEGVPC